MSFVADHVSKFFKERKSLPTPPKSHLACEEVQRTLYPPPGPCSKSLSICLNRGQQKQRCLQRFPRVFLQNISKHVFLKQFFVHSVQFFHTLLKSNFSVFLFHQPIPGSAGAVFPCAPRTGPRAGADNPLIEHFQRVFFSGNFS